MILNLVEENHHLLLEPSLEVPQHSPATESTTLSPLFGDYDLHFPPTNRSPSPMAIATSHNIFIMPDRPTTPNPISYVPPGSDDVRFRSLQKFTDHVAELHSLFACSGDNWPGIFISGSMVLEAAQALVLVIKGTGRSHSVEFSESDLVRSGDRDDKLSLDNIFQHSPWIFTA